ncbi:MAG TPA: hypothetical protein VJ936_04100 [Desulfobacteraceae bacterium]|nr:hypothetical protein [Desulfobacteraceae bacterium]
MVKKAHLRIKPWSQLLFFFFLIWVFGWIIGPFIENSIPVYKQIGQVVEARDIDSAAYMYEASVGSYDGEYYLTDSFKHSQRDDYGLTKGFFGGILSCFIILGIGWRYVM